MDGHYIRLIHTPEDAATVQARAARNARIDALGVDRSRFKLMPVWHWCLEAQAPERALARDRADATFDERLDAWRRIVKLPKVKK